MESTKIDKMHSKSPFVYFDIIHFSPFTYFFFVGNETKSLQWSLPLNLLRAMTIFRMPASISLSDLTNICEMFSTWIYFQNNTEYLKSGFLFLKGQTGSYILGKVGFLCVADMLSSDLYNGLFTCLCKINFYQ